MWIVAAVKKGVPVALKQPVRDYLDARALRAQPKLRFDSARLRSASAIDLTAITGSREIESSYLADHGRISSIYGHHEIMGGVNPGDRRAIYYLASHFKPQRVLEIGTHVGASTIYLASALRHFGGHLTTADIVDVNAPDAAWQSLGISSPPSSIASKLDLSQTVTFIAKPASEILRSNERYDLIFLDGDHSSRAVYQEISAALRLLNSNGLILLHDFYPNCKPITPDGSVINGPATAAKRISSETTELTFVPLGELPWKTKGGGNATSLALVASDH